MSTPVRILSVSDDDGLRNSRELLLENDGYETESITSNTALSVARVRSFDIGLICRSVEPERAMALTEMLRRYNPNILILSIRPLENRPEHFDADLEIPSGPEPVLDACRRLCEQMSARAGCYEASRQG
jgi:DNA-binding NtrC family response regulator